LNTLLRCDQFCDKPAIYTKFNAKIKQELQALEWVKAERGAKQGKTDKYKKEPKFRLEADLWAVLARKVVRKDGQPGGYVSKVKWHEERQYVLGTADVDERPDTEQIIGEVSQNNLGRNDEDYDRFPNFLLRYVFKKKAKSLILTFFR